MFGENSILVDKKSLTGMKQGYEPRSGITTPRNRCFRTK